MSDEQYDIVILGAGISGIAFARFYLDIHPKCSIAIIEEDTCIGGVWNSTRLYDEFWTQSGRRMVGFSDRPLTLPRDAPTYHGTFEAKYVTKYLEDYVDSHVYNGLALRSRICFGNRAEQIEKKEGVWTISTQHLVSGERTFRATKLVVATGLTSIPNMPSPLPHQERFQGPIRHHKQFGEISRTLLSTSECKHIAVLGGGKSATDMVYESVKRGKSVSWIIRKSGEGPALFFPAAGGGRYENSTEKGATRLTASFSPSSFMPNLWLTRLIHGTNVGRVYLKKKVQDGDKGCRDVAAYQAREGALPSFKNLETTTSSFWCTGPLGLVQHDEFWDILSKNVHVYRNDISAMKPHSIILDDGSEVLADAFLCGTGWNSHYPFFSKDQAHSLGLSHPSNEDSPEESKLWTSLLASADQRVLKEFPFLGEPPSHKKPTERTTTMRLYRCIAALEDPSVVFLGRAHLSNSFRTAEAQSIWATAYLDGSITLPPLEQAQQEVAYMNAFSRRRYPSHGATGDYLFFELIWYTDKLLDDVGLRSHRKGWWSDLIDPCLATDFQHAKDEYRKKYGF